MSLDLLLDSHTVLWALYEPRRLPHSLRSAITDTETNLYVSYASVWEILAKAARGGIPLAASSPHAILADIKSLDVVLLQIEEADIVAATSLPLHHRDPYGRMLVAQAQRRGLMLATKDGDLSLYAVARMWG